MGEVGIHGVSGHALRERIGHLSQVIRVDSFHEADGAARGARRIRMVNGGGIEIEVHPDRALDIGQVTVDGVPIAWVSPVGLVGPEAAEPDGAGWLQTFSGGLLTTCGLDTFGPPSEDDGVVFGQHGRIGTQKAQVIHAEASDAGVAVEGIVRQASVFGEALSLRRRISSPAGSDSIRIEDLVTNESFVEQPHMVLYHFNLGWPLLGAKTTIDIPARHVAPRDADAMDGIDECGVFAAPTPDFREQVFTHVLSHNSRARIVVNNPDNGLRFTLEIDSSQLPNVFEWKMAGQGHYALGVEPANTSCIAGRAAARTTGTLPTLGPGESTQYALEIRLRRLG